jgi:DNA-binding NarL/FixJ family response regulator
MNEKTSEIPVPCGSVRQVPAIFRMFFDSYQRGLLIADREGSSVHINRHLAHLLGYDSLRRFPAAAARRFATSPSGMGDMNLWTALLRDGLVVKHPIQAVTREGIARRLFVTGSLLERKRDGNHLAGWTVSEDPDGDTQGPPHRSFWGDPQGDLGSSADRSLLHLDNGTPVQVDHEPDGLISADADEAISLALRLMAQRQKDLEARLAQNWEISILPILEHLKDLHMPDCQRVLVETLDFSLRNILCTFGVLLVHASRRLSSREREITQMIRAGKSSRDIALALGLKLQTVQVYRKRIKKKLGLKAGSPRLAAVLEARLDPTGVALSSK